MGLTNDEVTRIISGAKVHMAIESMRRWVLVAGLLLAAVFATWTDFRPYYVVSAPDKHELEQLRNGAHQANPQNGDALIYEQPEEKSPAVVEVKSPEWEALFNTVEKIFTAGEVPDNWLYRLSADDIRDVKRYKDGKTSFKPDVRRLVFSQNEAPISSLFAGKKPGCDEIVVAFDSGKDRQFLKVYFSRAPELSGLGSGVYGVPESFSYPLRHLWFVPLLIMLLLYSIVPVSKASENVCAYKRWQVILSDFVGCLLYGMFMALPFLIVGGTVQALTEWIAFTAIFWTLAALGLCALWWSYFYAVYRIYVLDDQLIFVSPNGIRAVRFEDMLHLEPVRVVPPKWLIILSFMAALLGKGSSRIGQTGRASLLAASSSEGICIATKTGEAVYIWVSNSMGQNTLSHFDLLLKSLKNKGAHELAMMREFEAIFPPNLERYSDRKTTKIIDLENESETLLERCSRTLQEQVDDDDVPREDKLLNLEEKHSAAKLARLDETELSAPDHRKNLTT